MHYYPYKEVNNGVNYIMEALHKAIAHSGKCAIFFNRCEYLDLVNGEINGAVVNLVVVAPKL